MKFPKSFNSKIIPGLWILFLCFLIISCSKEMTTPNPVSLTPLKTGMTHEQLFNSTMVQTENAATETIQPSQTQITLTPSSTLHIDPYSTLTSQALILRATEISTFPEICEQVGTDLSPDNNWLAVSCKDNSLRIVNRENTQWILEFKKYLVMDYEDNGALLGGEVLPKFWTEDGRYLFFVSYIAFDGGGICFYGVGYQGLYRLDLNNGYVSTILAGVPSIPNYQIAFSPNGRYLSYSIYSGKDQLFLLDILSGEQKTIDVEEEYLGNMTWSQDGSLLAFSTCQSDDDYYQVQKPTLRIYSPETQEINTIFEHEKGEIYIEYWDEQKIMKIWLNNLFVPSTIGFLDLSKDLHTPILLTPVP